MFKIDIEKIKKGNLCEIAYLFNLFSIAIAYGLSMGKNYANFKDNQFNLSNYIGNNLIITVFYLMFFIIDVLLYKIIPDKKRW